MKNTIHKEGNFRRVMRARKARKKADIIRALGHDPSDLTRGHLDKSRIGKKTIHKCPKTGKSKKKGPMAKSHQDMKAASKAQVEAMYANTTPENDTDLFGVAI